MLNVAFPSSLGRFEIYYIIEKLIGEDKLPLDNEVTFDFTTLNFIKPAGVTILSNLFEWLIERGVKIFIIIPKYRFRHRNSPIAYLDDSNFFYRYMGEKIYKSSSPRSTTIPLQLVTYAESVQWLDNNLITWLSCRLNINRNSLTNIKICIQELFNNIKDHSDENIGCVFAQHYPKYKIVDFAISDFGVGIPYRVQQIYPTFKDSEAINRALKHGFTTRSIPRNAGAGLDILIEGIVNINKGMVYIHSNHGILECVNDKLKIKKRIKNIPHFYPGTMFNLIFRTDTIETVEDDEREDFGW